MLKDLVARRIPKAPNFYLAHLIAIECVEYPSMKVTPKGLEGLEMFDASKVR